MTLKDLWNHARKVGMPCVVAGQAWLSFPLSRRDFARLDSLLGMSGGRFEGRFCVRDDFRYGGRLWIRTELGSVPGWSVSDEDLTGVSFAWSALGWTVKCR